MALTFQPWFGLAVVTGALLAAPVKARPFLYMSSFDYTGAYHVCLANAEKALRQYGFDRDLKTNKSESDRAGYVYGFYRDEAIIAEIQCVQKAGITLLGVSGLDGDKTYELFQDLRKADW